MPATPRTAPRGFTLVELLVVIAIIGLISAVALPVVLPALNERRVSESARILQAVLSGARDAAIRANAPRGIRLLPDPVTPPGTLSSNRFVPIEPAPDYTEGLVNLRVDPVSGQLQVVEVLYSNVPNPSLYSSATFPTATIPTPPPVAIPENPTSWYWNIRQGDKIRFNESGPYYTIAGPMTIGPHSTGPVVNPERFINHGAPGSAFPRTSVEYLILVNGLDDNENGYVDESFDGLDNDHIIAGKIVNGDGIVDPLYNGIDDDGMNGIDDFAEATPDEYEIEKFDGTIANFAGTSTPVKYTIYRRPVVSPGARETTLPAGVVIDLTTWNAPTVNFNTAGAPTLRPERSRLPVDPYTGYVDIMVAPSGQVIQAGGGSSGGDINSLSPAANQPFYHFWLTDREGVVKPLWDINSSFKFKGESDILSIPNPHPADGSGQVYLLPMPKGTPGYPTAGPFLTGERRLVTLFVKTGQIVANSIEGFDANDPNHPFYDAQTGIKETQ